MKYSKSVILLSLMGISTRVACKTKTNVPSVIETKDCTEKVTYESLQPSLTRSCTLSSCHNENKKVRDFTIYQNFKNAAQKIEAKEHVRKKLSDEELMKFYCWVQTGMLEK